MKTGNPLLHAPIGSVDAHVVVMTPEMACNIRKRCHFPRQRDIQLRNVQRLAIEMSRGSFIPGTPIYLANLPGGETYLLNGNHTLEGIALSGVPQLLTVITYQAADLDEASRLYARHDLQRVRTWRDASRAVGLDQRLGNTDWTSQIYAALGYIVQRFAVNARTARGLEVQGSRDLRHTAFEFYLPTAELLIASLEGKNGANVKLVRRAGTLAVALETFRFQPAAAEEFWGGLVADDGLKIGDPRKALLDTLRATKSGSGNQRVTLALISAAAWNAFFRNEQRRYFKPGLASRLSLAGTPWEREDYDPLRDIAPEYLAPALPPPPAEQDQAGRANSAAEDHPGREEFFV